MTTTTNPKPKKELEPRGRGRGYGRVRGQQQQQQQQQPGPDQGPQRQQPQEGARGPQGNDKWCLYQYRVDMNPDIDDTGKRKRLVGIAVSELLQGGYLFNGTMLYTTQRIPNDQVELFAQEDEENIRITIRLVGDLVYGDPRYIQLFNIIIRKCLV